MWSEEVERVQLNNCHLKAVPPEGKEGGKGGRVVSEASLLNAD